MNSTTLNTTDAAADEAREHHGGHHHRHHHRHRHRHGRGRCSSMGGLYIAAMVIGFVIFWPIGLAMLVWAIWRDQIKALPFVQKMRDGEMPRAPRFAGFSGRRPSNSALAEYLEREQERLKAEQQKLDELVKAFEAFKEAERHDADRRDFESFLRQRGDDGDAPVETPRAS